MCRSEAIRLFLLLLVVSLAGMTGCKNFFVPVCVETNTCPATPTISSISPTSGSSGTAVTLTGTNFTGATAVNFGSTAGTSLSVVSATQITVDAPAGSGTVSVTVTNASGASNGESFSYSSSAAAVPAITGISPTSGASGITVTLTGTSFSGATAVNFGSVAATNFTVSSATQIVATVPAGSGTVSVKVTTPNGTSNAETFTYGSSAAVNSNIYVANATAGTIAGYSLSGGSLSNISGSPYTLGQSPTAIATTPDGSLLYLATAGGLYVYAIGSNGALTPLNGSQLVASALTTPTDMVIDKTNNWLFLVSNTSPALYEYQIDPGTGTLTAVTGSPVTLSGNPEQVYITPNNQYIYIGESPNTSGSGSGVGGIDVFSLDANTGVIGNQLHIPAKSSLGRDNALTSDSTSKFLFVGETLSGIRAFTIGSGGNLSEVSGSPFSTGSFTGPTAITVNQTNTYVYVAYLTTSEISGYTIGSTGALTLLSSSPFLGAGSSPVAMSLDMSGTYIAVAASSGSPDLTIFSFDGTTPGKLDPVARQATGTDPTTPISMTITK